MNGCHQVNRSLILGCISVNQINLYSLVSENTVSVLAGTAGSRKSKMAPSRRRTYSGSRCDLIGCTFTLMLPGFTSEIELITMCGRKAGSVKS